MNIYNMENTDNQYGMSWSVCLACPSVQYTLSTFLSNIVIVGLYIALKLIEDQSIGEFSYKSYIYGLVYFSSFILR